ncbi:anti-sigma factor family protein [Nocardiopsis aegyptia]|uniref:anti-sigma factor family protein n=1 Tax=Nocardiopsis aegyptia TaxID=220378 RepID=UPI0036703ECF
MTSHPDVEALAFFAEDLLDSDEQRTVAAHIDSCATCAATLDELAGVTRVLAEAPVPELPDDVADLIDQRLAEAAREPAAAAVSVETETGADTADSGTASGGGSSDDGASDLATVTPISRRRRAFGLPQLLIAAAAAVFVVGGGAAVITEVLQPSTESAGSASAPMEATEDEAPQDMGQAYRPEVLASETVYTESDLADQAGGVLEMSAGADADEEGDLEALSDEGQAMRGVEECAARLAEAFDTRVTLVDDAFYGTGSERAWVLYAPADDDRVDVYVLDPRCVQEDDVTRSVLAETTIDAR